MQETEEGRLVRQAQAGARSAFEQLYTRNVGRVYATCLRLTGRVAEAEDLTQETFVRAWQKLGSFEGRSRLSSWLHRLAVNVVINARRTKSSPESWEEPVEDPEEYAPTPAGPAPGIRIDLEEAVSSLPEGARIIFVLYDVYGYRHEEISRMTGLAVGTSKAQLHRARRLLRGVLGQ
jgi:RNA polymerase sigma-70 factor (ECF subfamily)